MHDDFHGSPDCGGGDFGTVTTIPPFRIRRAGWGDAHPGLMTWLDAVTVDVAGRTVTFWCHGPVDMCGAIAEARRILPSVANVVAMLNGAPDVGYLLDSAGEWTVRNLRPRRGGD